MTIKASEMLSRARAGKSTPEDLAAYRKLDAYAKAALKRGAPIGRKLDRVLTLCAEMDVALTGDGEWALRDAAASMAR